MDGDGIDDLVVVAVDDTVRWYRSDGAGGIDGVEMIASGLRNVLNCTLADLDGDGDLDVVLPDSDDNDMTFRRNDGVGRFGPEEFIFVGSTPTDSGAADVEGDGDLDVLYRVSGGRLAWRANDGNGSFGAEAILGTGPNVRPVTHDIDGDGDPDIVAHGDNGVGWWENLGSGQYTSHDIGTPSVWSFHVADVDADGDLDVSVAGRDQGSGGPVQVYANDGAGNFGPANAVFTSTRAPIVVVPLDVDRDGLTDLVTSIAYDREVVWSRHLGGLNYAPPVLLHTFDGPAQLATIDIDSDGDLDVAMGTSTSSGASQIHLGENTGSAPYLEARDLLAWTYGAYAAHLVDLDGDGDRDVVWSSYSNRIAAHENIGTGSEGLRFGPARVLVDGAFGRAESIRSADLDGDGLEDLVVAFNDASGDGVGWYRNLGGFQLAPRQSFAGSDSTRTDISVADLDGDGVEDVLFTALQRGRVAWQRNLGAGQFAAVDVLTTSVERVWEARAGDLDGDGDLDVAYTGLDEIGWIRNDALGFTAPIPIEQGSLFSGTTRCVDLDRDGDDDLIAPSTQFGVGFALRESLGGGNFAAPVDLPIPGSVNELEAVDYDGDGDVDLLYPGHDGTALLENTSVGAIAFAAPRVVASDAGSALVFQASDADLDGDLDLLRLHYDPDETVSVHEGLRVFGADVCDGVPNSTGVPATLSFTGTPLLDRNDLGLEARDLPRFSFGYFLVGDDTGFAPNAGGSQGTFCLGGSLGRFVAPGQIQSSGLSGSFGIAVDLTDVPLALGPVSSMYGDTWNFQAWYRDQNPSATSNFTSARSVLVR